MTIRILIADDHPIVGAGLTAERRLAGRDVNRIYGFRMVNTPIHFLPHVF